MKVTYIVSLKMRIYEQTTLSYKTEARFWLFSLSRNKPPLFMTITSKLIYEVNFQLSSDQNILFFQVAKKPSEKFLPLR